MTWAEFLSTSNKMVDAELGLDGLFLPFGLMPLRSRGATVTAHLTLQGHSHSAEQADS